MDVDDVEARRRAGSISARHGDPPTPVRPPLPAQHEALGCDDPMWREHGQAFRPRPGEVLERPPARIPSRRARRRDCHQPISWTTSDVGLRPVDDVGDARDVEARRALQVPGHHLHVRRSHRAPRCRGLQIGDALRTGDLPARSSGGYFSSVVDSFLHPFAKPARPAFISVVRGEGALLWTADGAELIDAMASLWYCNVGHGRRDIADAVAAQIADARGVLVLRAVHQPAGRRARRPPRPRCRRSRRRGCSSAGRARRPSTRRSSSPASPTPSPASRSAPSSSAASAATTGRTSAGPAPRASSRTAQGWGPLVPDVVQVPADDIEALSVTDGRTRRARSPPCWSSRCRAPAASSRRRRATSPRRGRCATATARCSSSTR